MEFMLNEAGSWIDRHVNPRARNVQFDGTKFTYEVNTSCHCHPEYETVSLTPEQNDSLFTHLEDCDFFEAHSKEEEFKLQVEDC